MAPPSRIAALLTLVVCLLAATLAQSALAAPILVPQPNLSTLVEVEEEDASEEETEEAEEAEDELEEEAEAESEGSRETRRHHKRHRHHGRGRGACRRAVHARPRSCSHHR